MFRSALSSSRLCRPYYDWPADTDDLAALYADELIVYLTRFYPCDSTFADNVRQTLGLTKSVVMPSVLLVDSSVRTPRPTVEQLQLRVLPLLLWGRMPPPPLLRPPPPGLRGTISDAHIDNCAAANQILVSYGGWWM